MFFFFSFFFFPLIIRRPSRNALSLFFVRVVLNYGNKSGRGGRLCPRPPFTRTRETEAARFSKGTREPLFALFATLFSRSRVVGDHSLTLSNSARQTTHCSSRNESLFIPRGIRIHSSVSPNHQTLARNYEGVGGRDINARDRNLSRGGNATT